MAFPVRPASRGKHRRPHRLGAGAALAGVVVLAGGGTAGALAAVSPGRATAPTARNALFAQVLGAPGLLAQGLDTQATAQREAADVHATPPAPPTPAAPRTTSPAQAAPKSGPTNRPAAKSPDPATPAPKSTAKTGAGSAVKPAPKPGAGSTPKPSAKPASKPTANPRTKSSAKAAPKPAPKPKATPAPEPKATPASPAKTATGSAGAAAVNGWTRPVANGPIGTAYGTPGSLWSAGHSTGVDLLVPSGTAVHAVAAGTVVSAGWDGGYGYDVIIRHADGRYTLYGNLSKTLVSAGQAVTEGQQIGVSGATGNSTGPHLHFEVRTSPAYGSDIDPVAYLRSHGVEL
ncbi:Peptidase family M23 [Actinacidiphila yanglinensis]|uniref:Peptidase family M23 n=1 Tax=Actinacidiphila yanglinensis TaxID=310779 RepID=A0A1H5X3X1_9ACTN|nr:M23 family metallopeptidase [Actinacidiphila yanglinensis]SEG06077.1 Peptidase family M23 [Actinacidiphila yanglinensis]